MCLMVEMEIECESERIVIVYYRVKQIGRGVRMNVCQKSEKIWEEKNNKFSLLIACDSFVLFLFIPSSNLLFLFPLKFHSFSKLNTALACALL